MVTPARPTPAPAPARSPYSDTSGKLPPDNSGVPKGGAPGTALLKNSAADFDVAFSGVAMGTVTNTGGNLLADAVLIGANGVSDIQSLSSLGSSGQVLTSNGSAAAPSWKTVSAGFTNPMSTYGDLIYGATAGLPTRLAAGSSGQVLTVSSGLPVWAASAAGFTNPMTTSGDIIYGGSAGAATRLAAGTSGQVLTMVSGAPSWAATGAGFTNPMTTAGDIIYATTAGAPLRLAAGTSGQVLTMASGLPSWAAPPAPAFTSISSSYTFVLGDANNQFLHPASDTTARPWAIDSNANVPYPVGTLIRGINRAGAGVLTISIVTDTLEWTGSNPAVTGSRTVNSGGEFTITKMTTTVWAISGVGVS